MPKRELGRGVEPGQDNRDEPAHRSLGRRALGSRESVEAIDRELLRRHIVPPVATCRGVSQQAGKHGV